MHNKHYPNVAQVRIRLDNLIKTLGLLKKIGIPVEQITIPEVGVPVVQVINSPNTYRLNGELCGMGSDNHGLFVRKERFLFSCKVTWLEDKRC